MLNPIVKYKINQILDNTYPLLLNVVSNTICNRTKQFKNTNTQFFELSQFITLSKLLQSECLTHQEATVIYSKLRFLVSCNITNVTPQPIPPTQVIIYAGVYAFGASNTSGITSSSLPIAEENYIELGNQIETNVSNYNIQQYTQNQVVGTLFAIETTNQQGIHFIAIPTSLNITKIYDATNTDVTQAFITNQIVINNTNYTIYFNPFIIQPNIQTLYYLS